MPAVRHEHCERCFDAHCQVPPWISIGCLMVKCPNNCGAALHACKEEEHLLLCPNETVTCLNAGYGCPLAMPRHRRAQHLEVCPASVVSCSQEWNRWPVPDTDSSFYRNVAEQSHPHLDVALALRDQELLFESIKMKNIFPEFTEDDTHLSDVGVFEDECEASPCLDSEGPQNVCTLMRQDEVKDRERETLAKSKDVDSLENYISWERIFKKEMNGCDQTTTNVRREEIEKRESSASPSMTGATGLAPWQDGVLERLGKEANIAEYNMYLVHNGAMLINFGQLAACTPREKDFVYGNLEPIEVKTIRSFKVPTSYRAKRCHLKDPSRKTQVSHQCVDTADLGLCLEDLPKSDEVRSTLLCCLEKELKGHSISESASTDALYVDIGTQTYIFSLAPFKAEASLGDLIAGKPRCLYVQTETESVTRRHNKTSSAFSYKCGLFFRRDEYRSHFRNMHSDIQAGLDGWFQQRCPLAYLGCTFAQTRLHPAGQQAEVKYHHGANKVVIQPDVPSGLLEVVKTSRHPDPLSRLPLEILQHIARHLDTFTLSQLSQVSRLMREVCATLLQTRGMVSLKWEKKTYSHGGSAWKSRKKVWEFSSLFAPVERWSFSDTPSMAEHLHMCCFYQRDARTQPLALRGLSEVSRDHHRSFSLWNSGDSM